VVVEAEDVVVAETVADVVGDTSRRKKLEPSSRRMILGIRGLQNQM
jgi:hypothetical protein